MKKKKLQKQDLRPKHPGDELRRLLTKINMDQGQLATRLKTNRLLICRLINGHIPLSIDMAIRLGIFFGTGPNKWIKLQQLVDIWEEESKPKRNKIYKSIEPLN